MSSRKCGVDIRPESVDSARKPLSSKGAAAGQGSGCKCAPAETENEYFIAFVVVFDNPLVDQTDVFIEALAEIFHP
jgi:hypothetical protein